MILVLSIGFLILYVDNKRTKECLGNYIRANAQATAPRIQAIQDTDEAVDKMVARISTASSKEQSAAALAEYRATRAAAEAKRTANPPPPFPERCV